MVKGASRTRIAGAMILALAATGCGAATSSQVPPHPEATKAPSPALRPYYTQRVTWRDCGGGFQCTKVEVPLDYGEPDGHRITISVNRLPAHGERIGSLLLNPGGPGGSGLEMARNATNAFSRRIRQRFDIVGFDPRGVGESAPVKCLEPKEKDEFLNNSEAPDIEHAREAAVDFARKCGKRAGRLLPHVGTENAARDMDVLRAVVGDRRLTYHGVSYGTELGAVYADLFPAKVRAMSLDSAMDPTLDRLDLAVAQIKGMETALRAFVGDCLKARDCPLESRTVDGGIDEIVALRERAEKKPLANTVNKEREVTGSWVLSGVRFALYSKSAWPQLRKALAKAITENDGTLLQEFAEPYTGRRPDGTYNNMMEASTAIACATYPHVKRKAAARAARRMKGDAPMFGVGLEHAWLSCHKWPAPAPRPRKTPRAKGSAPILVIGIQRDPATPPEWAEALAARLENTRLVRYDGDGHGAYRQAGSICVDYIVDGYLINLELPESPANCSD